MKPLLRSCWISPLMAFPMTVGVFTLWWPLSQFATGESLGPSEAPEILGAALVAGIASLGLAYPAMLMLGIPITLALRKLTPFRLPVMMLTGGLAGCLAFSLYDQLWDWMRDLRYAPPMLAASVLSGIATAERVWRRQAGAPRTRPYRLQPLPAFPGGPTMLTVLYDGRCALCRRARAWLDEQAKYVPLDYLSAGSQEARRRFPGLDHDNTLVDLTVVGMNGEVYHGAKAWIMCLWALKKYRGTALRLATPELMPGAKRVIAWVSRNRFRMSEAWKT
jgi:predicted DCC family thiol-disulfide oxidoreductase YuxK